MPGETNEARFTIEGTPSEDANGNRGYDGTYNQSLDITLEVDPSSALAVTYSVYDPNVDGSPLASKDATLITFTENGQSSITPSDVNDTVHLKIPFSAQFSSWIVRAVAITPGGAEVWERIVTLRYTNPTPNLRRLIPGETAEYAARGIHDALADQAAAINYLAMGASDTFILTFGVKGTPNSNYFAVPGFDDDESHEIFQRLTDNCTLIRAIVHARSAPGSLAGFGMTVRKDGGNTLCAVELSGAGDNWDFWVGSVSFDIYNRVSVRISMTGEINNTDDVVLTLQFKWAP